MILICAWCQKKLGEKEPLENKDHTHGICPACSTELKKKYRVIEVLELKNPEPKKKHMDNKEK